MLVASRVEKIVILVYCRYIKGKKEENMFLLNGSNSLFHATAALLGNRNERPCPFNRSCTTRKAIYY